MSSKTKERVKSSLSPLSSKLNSFKYIFIFILALASLLVPSTLLATELAHDKFTNNNADGYSRDDGWTNQLKIRGKKSSQKTYNFGTTYANANLTVTFQIKWRGGWEDSGPYKDYFKVFFNDSQVVNDTYGGTTYSWHNYTLTGTADANGNFKIKFYANTTSLSEYVVIDNVIITTIVEGSTAYHEGSVPFVLINPSDTQNIIGNTQIIGNTVECVTSSFRVTSSNYSNLDCSNDLNKNDNKYITKFINSDTNLSTFNSSTATFKSPSTFKEIAWVGLFWQGHINNYSYISSTTNYIYHNSNSTFDGWDWYYTYDVNGYNYGTNYNVSNDFTNNNIENTLANTVQLKIGNDSYAQVTAESLNYYIRTSDANNAAKGATYSAFANITDYFSSINSSVDVNITVANVLTTEGLELNLGNYGAWTIVVVYKENEQNTQSKLRNNSIYLGYTKIYDGNPASIDINGFLLPKSGAVDSQVAVFAGEGEYAYNTDSMSLDGTTLGSSTCTTDANDQSCSTNIFDAKLSPNIQREPFLTNSNGIDIDIFDTSAIMTAKRDANPNAANYSSTIELASDWDLFLPSMVSFTTELYKPRVCYYIEKVTDEDNTTVYENRAFVGEIDPTKKYKIDFWISNMKKTLSDTDLEVAELVQIYMGMNDFNYTSQTTVMKNIGETNFVNITDQSGDDIGEWDSNKSTWRVGTGANITQGGTLQVAANFDDNSSKVFSSLNGSFLVDANATNFDLTNFFSFKASFKTNSITIGSENALVMEQCVDLNTIGAISRPPIGAFNVVNENFSSTSMQDNYEDSSNALYTQVAGQSFNVKILSLDATDTTSPISIIPFNYGDINLSVIQTPDYSSCAETDTACKQLKCDLEPPISGMPVISNIDFNTIDADNNGIITQSYTANQAHQNVSFKVTFTNNLGQITHACSLDNFAIRPASYSFDMNSTQLIGGKQYQLDTNATSTSNNNNLTGYTHLISSATLKSSLVIPSGCTSVADDNSSIAATFTYGKDVTYIKTANIGDYNISMEDSNWTQVDQNKPYGDDCDKINTYSITHDSTTKKVGCYSIGSKIFSFTPKEFKNTLTITNASNGFTYISNDRNMSAQIDINTTARLEDNATATSYSANCYAEDINSTIQLLNLPSSVSSILFFDDGNITTKKESNTTQQATFSTKDNNFTAGTANLTMRFNFPRDELSALNPFKISKNDFNITSTIDTNGTTGEDFNRSSDQNTTFYYGRVHAPDYRYDSISGPATIYYEVYSDQNKSIRNSFDINGSESTDSINWYVNTLHVSNDGNVTYKPINGVTLNRNTSISTASGVDTITVTTPTISGTPELPHKDKIEFNPSSSWLIYSPTDFLVEFYGGAEWAGQGRQGKTVDLNISKRQNKRLDW